MVGDAGDRRLDRRPGDGARRPQRRRSSSTPRRFSPRPSSSRGRRYDSTPAEVPGRGVWRTHRLVRLRRGISLRPPALARRGADVRQGGLGARRRRPAAADDFRPAGVSGRRQHGGGHRRALRRARHRRGTGADRAALDCSVRRRGAAADHRAGVLHRRRLLRRARLRADAAGSPRCAFCSRISAGRFSGCSARCCCRWRCRTAFAAASSPPSSRSSRSASSVSSYWTAYQLDRAGWSPRTLAFALGAMFCVPGRVVADRSCRGGRSRTLPTTLEPATLNAGDEEEVLEGRSQR